MRPPNILTHYGSILKLKHGMMCAPRFADFHTSNRCNHNCHGCAYAGELDGKMMSEEDHNHIVAVLLAAGVKGFDFAGGGEPLLLPYLPRLWDDITARGARYGVITNGSLLTPALCEQLVDQATYVRVSLEASDADTYATYKGVPKAQWEKVMANITTLAHIKHKRKSECDITLKFGVGKSLYGIDHYRNGIALAKELGADGVAFKALRHEPEELNDGEKGLESARLCIASQDETPGFVSHWIRPRKGDTPQCWLNPVHVVVDHLGDVYLCCYYYYRKDAHLLGNMLETPFYDLWYGEKHHKAVEAIDKAECAKVDCKFFRHHDMVEEAFKNGRQEFL